MNKTKLTAIALAIGLLLALLWGVRQCGSVAEKDNQISELTLKLSNTSDSLARCQLARSEADADAQRLVRDLGAALKPVRALVASQTQRQQRSGIIRDYVKDGLLPESRLIDTLYAPGPVVADSTLVAAVATKTYWANVFKNQRDSLATAYADCDQIKGDQQQLIETQNGQLLSAEAEFRDKATDTFFLWRGKKRAYKQAANRMRTIRNGP